jgi:F-type H+-transporting ATPase subunit gamma
MPSLKDLKNRIKSIKSTQKITKAQKVVAASKLKRAQDQAVAARPYSQAMERLLSSLAASMTEGAQAPKLMSGTGKDHTHLIIVATGDRGLCGAFNSSIVRATKRKVRELTAQDKTVKLYFIGRKGFEQMRSEFGSMIVGQHANLPRKLHYGYADEVVRFIMGQFEEGSFDACHIVYNQFKSAISQAVTFQQLIPLALSNTTQSVDLTSTQGYYEYEPEEEEILADLLPRNLGVQIYKSLLENAASEQGARMTAMDNATRNAGDMIKKLNLKYNRTRQAAITKELIEIISGAEAV